MPEAASDASLAAREQRYILLLEKRIADLEVQLKVTPGKDLGAADVISAPETVVNGLEQKAVGKSRDAEKTTTPNAPAVNGIEKPKEITPPAKDATEVPKSTDSKSIQTDEADEKPKPPPSRVRQVVYRYWDDNAVFEDRELSAIKESQDTTSERAFTFRRVMDDVGKSFQRSEIDIESDALRQMMKKVLDKLYPFLDWNLKLFRFVGPFSHVVYMYDELVEEAKERDGDDDTMRQTREDLRSLLKLVRECNEMADYFQNRETDTKAGRVTYEYLWTMFPPRTEVFAKKCLGEPQIWQVMDTPDTSQADSTTFTAEMWCYDWNGTEMVRAFHDIDVCDKYEGSKNVTSMNAYPLKYFKDESVKDRRAKKKITENGEASESASEKGEKSSTAMSPDELREMLVERGLEFERRCKLGGKDRLFGYERDALALASKKGVTGALSKSNDDSRSQTDDNSSSDTSFSSSRMIKIKGNYIQDSGSYQRYGHDALMLGGSKPNWVSGSTNKIDDGASPQQPIEQWYRLCPPRVLGYATKEKSWAQFSLSKTRDVQERQTNAFQSELQLDQRYKDMLLALVNMHESQAKVGDMVQDKGNSLVLLLHGPPGVGKSLTAETIADATRKPLIVVSVAEIGLQAEKAEKNLETMFTLASTWEAILLVDEADVFLETRTEHADPNRNALVSVLLRVLEYYQGVIILTTNRITSIDIAVQSRIHLAIQYQDLTPPQRIEIFKYFLNQVPFHGTQDKQSVEKWFTDYACREELNGRQIRNLVTSAQALSASKKKDLNEDSMRTVMTLMQEFQRTVRERTMLQRAKNEGGRMSAY